jgi:hypothetical protein
LSEFNRTAHDKRITGRYRYYADLFCSVNGFVASVMRRQLVKWRPLNSFFHLGHIGVPPNGCISDVEPNARIADGDGCGLRITESNVVCSTAQAAG